jgi:hypothetical protein
MQGCAYVAPEDAKISIFDWGFLHFDATTRGRPGGSFSPVSALLERHSRALHDEPRCFDPVRGLA